MKMIMVLLAMLAAMNTAVCKASDTATPEDVTTEDIMEIYEDELSKKLDEINAMDKKEKLDRLLEAVHDEEYLEEYLYNSYRDIEALSLMRIENFDEIIITAEFRDGTSKSWNVPKSHIDETLLFQS